DKKFVNDSEILKTIDEKIQLSKIRYFEMAQHRDLQFQRDLAILNGYQIPVEPIAYVEPKEEIPVGDAPDDTESTEESIATEESLVIEEPLSTKKEILETDDVSEEPLVLPVESTIPEPVLPTEDDLRGEHSTIVYSRGVDKDTFVGTIDQEYLRRLNNIKQMKILLDSRKKEISSSYEADRIESKELELRFVQKMEEVSRKMDLLKENYEKKAKNTRNQSDFETENTKLNVELQSREEQLRKLREEDMTKMNSRYQNSIVNIDEQFQALLEEEKSLKDEFVFKQQKTQSKVQREEQMVQKLHEEQLEGRIIESQEEIKRRHLAHAEPVIEDTSTPISVAAKEEPIKTVVKESQPISSKEQELRQIFAKYVEAQKRLLQDFVFVREYQEAMQEKRAYLTQNEKLDQQIRELSLQMQGAISESEKSRLEWQTKDIAIRQDNNRAKISYRDRQLTNLVTNKHVQDYIKIIEHLDMMNHILKQYATKRGQE
ncbi:MAG: hypothetical protein WCQ80_05015, partial [Bacilli bacterium]